MPGPTRLVRATILVSTSILSGQGVDASTEFGGTA